MGAQGEAFGVAQQGLRVRACFKASQDAVQGLASLLQCVSSSSEAPELAMIHELVHASQPQSDIMSS
jgi:hypothetical protein